MINAMDEFLNAVGTDTVLCADILYVHDNVDVTIQLKCSYSFEGDIATSFGPIKSGLITGLKPVICSLYA